jgi:hypothetical protein
VTHKDLIALIPELKALGVKRVRIGDVEVEFPDQLSVIDLAAETDTQPLDPTKCHKCQARPKGRIIKDLCRECGLAEAGVQLD